MFGNGLIVHLSHILTGIKTILELIIWPPVLVPVHHGLLRIRLVSISNPPDFRVTEGEISGKIHMIAVNCCLMFVNKKVIFN
jgi:hypothetical protein